MQDKKLFSRVLSKRDADSRASAPIFFLHFSPLHLVCRGKPPGMCGTITFGASLVVRALEHEPRAKNPGGSHVFRDPLPASLALISATHMPRNLLSALSPPTLAPLPSARATLRTCTCINEPELCIWVAHARVHRNNVNKHFSLASSSSGAISRNTLGSHSCFSIALSEPASRDCDCRSFLFRFALSSLASSLFFSRDILALLGVSVKRTNGRPRNDRQEEP